MSPLRLVLAALVRYRLGVTTLLLTVALVGGAVAATLTVRTAIVHALETSTSLRAPEGAVQVQALTAEARAALDARDGLLPVLDGERAVSTAGEGAPAAADATVRLTTVPYGPLGVVTAGRAATTPGEAALTHTLADDLGVRIGDPVTTGSDEFVVVGLMTDPALIQARHLSGIVSEVSPLEATSWVTDEPGEVEYADSLGEEVAITSSVLVRAIASDNVPLDTGPARAVAITMLVLGAAAVALLLMSLRRAMEADRLALLQAGLSPARLHRWALLTCVALTTGSAAAGAALGWMSILIGRTSVSSLWSQSWLEAPLPVAGLLVSILVLGLAPLLALGLIGAVFSSAGQVEGGGGRRTAVAIAISVLAVGGFAADVWQRFGARDALPIIGLLVGNGLIVALAVLRRRWARSAASRFAVGAGRGLVVASLVIVTLVYVSSLQSAWTSYVHTKYQERPLQQTGQADGSLVVEGVPDDLVPELTAAYDARGGTDARSARQVAPGTWRVDAVAPSLATCAGRTPDFDIFDPPRECLAGTDSLGLVFVSGLAADAAETTVRAAPELVEEHRIGLLVYRGEEEAPERTMVLDAVADPSLGNRMPGVVLPQGHPLVRELGLEGAGDSDLYLPAYGRLDPADRATVRGAILQLAPAAVPSQNPTDTSVMPSGVWLWGLGASAFLALFLGSLLTGFVASASWIRDLVTQLGATRRRRLAIAAEVMFLPLVAPVVAIATTAGVMAVRATTAGIGYGVAWLVPFVVSLLVVCLAVLAFARVPSPAGARSRSTASE